MDEYEQQYEEYPRDEKIDEVKPQIMSRIFDKFPRKVFYSVQVETALERDYFHWITGKGLAELANEARLVRTPQHVVGQFVNFYTHPGHRYFRREAKQLASLLARLYDPEFTQAIGSHCEMLFDSALARRHFVPVAWYTNEWNGKKWPDSNQNLDRIVIRDQIAYGIEIKNTQNYIDREELQDKTKQNFVAILASSHSS